MTRFGVRTMGRGMTRPGMESLTCCSVNRTRFGAGTLRRDTT